MQMFFNSLEILINVIRYQAKFEYYGRQNH